jgi:hypothetical protein
VRRGRCRSPNVLFGAAQQLEQPVKGSHSDGAEVSALEHLLAGAKTISPDKGLFLEKTWRLHPKLCFTSEVFYEERLHPREGLEQQKIEGHPWLGESGLWFVPLHHEGNRNASAEEVERLAARNGISSQPEPTQCRDVARLHGCTAPRAEKSRASLRQHSDPLGISFSFGPLYQIHRTAKSLAAIHRLTFGLPRGGSTPSLSFLHCNRIPG